MVPNTRCTAKYELWGTGREEEQIPRDIHQNRFCFLFLLHWRKRIRLYFIHIGYVLTPHLLPAEHAYTIEKLHNFWTYSCINCFVPGV